MQHLTQQVLTNWIAIYLATGSCVGLAILLSVAVLGVQLYQERAWNALSTSRGALLFVPKAWWQWQKLYFLSTPVTLTIVIWFATTLPGGLV